MYCEKCKKDVEDGAKFCPRCGEKAVKKTEEVKETKAVKKEVKEESSGLGIAGMVIGIISLLLSWLLVFILLPVIGLILSCCAKGKKGFKIAGIILNGLAILVTIILIFVYINVGTSLIFHTIDKNKDIIQDTIDSIEDDDDVQDSINNIKDSVKDGIDKTKKAIKGTYPYGTWTCLDYYETGNSEYADDVTKAPSDKKTVLKLNNDGTFKYGPYVDADKNYYKGTFTYTIETEKNAEYSDKKVKFIDIKAPVTEGMVDGTTLTPSADANMNLEMELFEDYNYDTSLILFYSSYNTYYCQR